MQLYLHASQSILLVREFLVAFFPLYYIFFGSHWNRYIIFNGEFCSPC
jgi:hypothetical protein